MDILIGKHGNQPFKLTDSTISREHAILRVDKATGKITLRDNNSLNGTWVLAKDGSFKRINDEVQVGPDTFIRLGANFTCTVKKFLEKKEAPPVNISKLRDTYDYYMQNKMQLDAKSSNIMMWRMASMSLGGLLGLVLSMILPQDLVGSEFASNVIKVAATIMAIAIAWLIVDIKNKSLIRHKNKNEQFFKENYCCPKCGYHFGMKVYHNILAEGKCPNNSCKCKFTGN